MPFLNLLAALGAKHQLGQRGSAANWLQRQNINSDTMEETLPASPSMGGPTLGQTAQSAAFNALISGLFKGKSAQQSNVERGAPGTWRQLESGKSLSDIDLDTQVAEITRNFQGMGIDTEDLFQMIQGQVMANSWAELVRNYLSGGIQFKQAGGSE